MIGASFPCPNTCSEKGKSDFVAGGAPTDPTTGFKVPFAAAKRRFYCFCCRGRLLKGFARATPVELYTTFDFVKSDFI